MPYFQIYAMTSYKMLPKYVINFMRKACAYMHSHIRPQCTYICVDASAHMNVSLLKAIYSDYQLLHTLYENKYVF